MISMYVSMEILLSLHIIFVIDATFHCPNKNFFKDILSTSPASSLCRPIKFF